MSYTKQTWDTTSYVNPTRMNHIEDGIEAAANTADSAASAVIAESKTVWTNLTLGANSATTVQTFDVSKSGYTAVGVVGYRFDGRYGEMLSFSKLSIENNTLTYLIANNGNNSATGINVYVTVLYVKQI